MNNVLAIVYYLMIHKSVIVINFDILKTYLSQIVKNVKNIHAFNIKYIIKMKLIPVSEFSQILVEVNLIIQTMKNILSQLIHYQQTIHYTLTLYNWN